MPPGPDARMLRFDQADEEIQVPNPQGSRQRIPAHGDWIDPMVWPQPGNDQRPEHCPPAGKPVYKETYARN